jgi:DivIVA domain-containing protein
VITVTQHEHPFHYYRSPSEIREVQFSHRVRGLDEYEVAEYLDLLADQVHATNLELARLREERDKLREENEHLRTAGARPVVTVSSSPSQEGTPHAAALLLNAQRVADDLVEEAVRRARDMLTVARAEKNAILRNAQEAAAAMLLEARDTPAPVSSYQPSTYRETPPQAAPTTTYHASTYRGTHQASSQGVHLAPAPDPAPAPVQRSWQLDGHAAV